MRVKSKDWRRALFHRAEVLLVFIAVIIASVYGNSDGSYRMAASMIPLVLALCSIFYRLLSLDNPPKYSHGFLLLSLGFIYFAFRALCSEVAFYGDRDFLLFSAGFSVALALQCSENRNLVRRWLPYLALLLLFIQSLPLLWQWSDRTYVPLRPELETREQLSGFFGHRNFFGLLMGIAGLSCLGFLLLGRPRAVRRRNRLLERGAMLLGCGWGVTMSYLSESRGALVAVLIGLVGIVLVWLLLLAAQNPRQRMWALFAVVGIALFACFGGKYTMDQFLANRETGMGFFGNNSRFDMLLLAADSEPENKWIGGGSRFFQYECLRVWDSDRMNNSLGDPQVVHNEFVEALVNYGYIGAAFLIFLIVIACSLWVMRLSYLGFRASILDQFRSKGLALSVISGVVLGVICIQSVVDFSLHLLPLMMIFGGCLGHLMSFAPKRTYSPGIGAALLSLLVGLLIWVCVPYWISLPLRERLVYGAIEAKQQKIGALRTLGQRTGDGERLLRACEMEFTAAALDKEHGEERLKNALELGQLALAAHPKSGPTALLCARIKIEQGEYPQADHFMDLARVQLAGVERWYGVLFQKGVLEYKKLRQRWGRSQHSSSTAQRVRQLKDVLEWIEASKVREYRMSSWQKNLTNEIYSNYYLGNSALLAALGSNAARQGKYATALTYLEFARKLWTRARSISQGVWVEFYDLELPRLSEQIEFLKKKRVRIDKSLSKELESSIQVLPRQKVKERKQEN